MRVNDLLNNIQIGSGTGINNDLSLIDDADSNKNRATALSDGNRSAVGFFKSRNEAAGIKYMNDEVAPSSSNKNGISSMAVAGRKMNPVYTLNEARGLNDKDDSMAAKILNNVEVPHTNDKELIKNLTGDDYESLSEEGMSIEKFSKERLERAIERIKENRETREMRLAEGVEKQQEFKETVERMAFLSSMDSGTDKLIAKMLYEADIPVTEENIEAVKQAADMADAASKLTDSSESYLIKNNLQPTIDNIYKASHVGEMRLAQLDDSAWESLKKRASDIVAESGESMKHGLENARWLVEHDLPVTADNILYKSRLDELREGKIDQEKTFEAAVEAIRMGDKASNGLLILGDSANDYEQLEKITDIVEQLSGVSDRAIYSVCDSTGDAESVTLAELTAQDSVHSDSSQGNDEVNAVYPELDKDSPITEEYVTTKLLVEEIRYSLTIEAGRRLMSKGIDIVSDGLMRVAEGIRELEREYFKDLFKEIELDYGKLDELKAADVSEAANLAADTENSLRVISSAPMELYKATFSVRHSVTLAELSEEGELLIRESVRSTSQTISINPASMKSALSYYDESSTEVRKDLGDSIKKAFSGSIDQLLKSNGLEITEGNRRAVRILGYNSMEITAENIEQIKFYDAKVTGLIEKMTPPVVMTMIRDGVNPLELTIDELDEKVSSILNEHGKSFEQKYSEFLVKMEGAGSISRNERNAYIGIYRLLYNVEKNDGAAIGSLLNSGRELSFRNLMTEVRTMNNGIDLAADDSTEIKSSHYNNSVTGQIDEAFLYQRGLVRDSLGVSEPMAWDYALKGRDLGSTTIEDLHEGLFSEKAVQNSEPSVDALAEEIVETMAVDTPVSDFLNGFRIRDSFENRKAAEEIFLDPGNEDSSISVSPGELTDALDSYSRFDELLGIRTRMANALAGQAFSTAINSISAAELNGRVERIRMLGELAGKGHYRLNINDDEGPKDVNLTMIMNSGNSGTVSVEIKKQDFSLQADMSLVIMDSLYNGPSASGVTVRVSGNDMGDATGISNQMKSALKDNGINADNINVISGIRNDEAYLSHLSRRAEEKQHDTGSTGIENADVLLKAAKAMLSVL